jgi:hypothetical protein
MLGPGITSRTAVPASRTQVLDNADVAYLFIGPGIASRASVPASCTQVLDKCLYIKELDHAQQSLRHVRKS